MRLAASILLAGSSLIAMSVPPPLHAGAAEDLARLGDEYWQGYLAAHPTAATALGDHRHDDRLEDITSAGIARERQRLEALRARVRAVDERALAGPDRLTRSALLLELEDGIDQIDCAFHDWVVDPLSGPQVDFFNLVDVTRFETAEDGRSFVRRCRAMGPYLDTHVAHLRAGKKRGRVASRDAVRKVVEQLDALLARPDREWALFRPLEEPSATWPRADREAFERDLAAAIREVVRPAFARYHHALSTDIAPAARPPEKAGLAALPDGPECYLKRIRIQTSLDRAPEELHALGLEEVARFRRELAELGKRVLGTGDVAEIQRKLRTDPLMHFDTPEAVEAKAREALARARAEMPRWFGILPRADCEVKVMGMHEAPHSTVAYYRQPAADGSRPGLYMINTYRPETRPRYEAEALAFHEAIPGHHLQIAIAQELAGIPAFRRHQGVTAYVEGWALYTERLAEEMGLYSTDLDRIGMLSYDAWRACRLVVDTGLHALGWSRQQAIDYMLENSVLAENNIVNEVDRYLTWPAQALAYKVGQLEILSLRDEARNRLGPRFDIRQFHDVVLRNGAVALPVLRQQVKGWIEEVERAK